MRRLILLRKIILLRKLRVIQNNYMWDGAHEWNPVYHKIEHFGGRESNIYNVVKDKNINILGMSEIKLTPDQQIRLHEDITIWEKGKMLTDVVDALKKANININERVPLDKESLYSPIIHMDDYTIIQLSKKSKADFERLLLKNNKTREDNQLIQSVVDKINHMMIPQYKPKSNKYFKLAIVISVIILLVITLLLVLILVYTKQENIADFIY